MFDNLALFKHGSVKVALWLRFLILTLPIAGLVMLSIYQFTVSEQQTHLSTIRLETAHHIESQAKNINEEIKRSIAHVHYLGQHNEVLEMLQGDHEALIDVSDTFKGFVQYLGVYDQARLLNKQGQEVVRANCNNAQASLVPKAQLQDKHAATYFKQTMSLAKGEVFISKFALNIEHGNIEYPLKPVIRYAMPLFDGKGHKHGILVLNYLGQVLIQRYLDATDVIGENMLMNANGFFMHADDESMTWGSELKARQSQSMSSRFPQVWQRIIDERDGQFLTDAGLFTFVTISPYSLLEQQEPSDGAAGDWIIVSYVTADKLLKASELSSELYSYGVLLLLALWMVLSWFWARSEARRQQAFQHLELLGQQKNNLLRSQLNMQEEERHILARALHDDMGQSLTSIQAYVAAIRKAALHDKMDKVLSSTSYIRDIIKNLQQIVRSRLHDLRPASLDRLGLNVALDVMLDEFSQREGMICEIHCSDALALNEQQNIHLYRIVQEALTNISKHAKARVVSVELSFDADRLLLSISDDGCGMEAVEERGLGLLGIRERTELLQGQLNIQSSLGSGVQLQISIPLQRAR